MDENKVGTIIVELKSVEGVSAAHKKQLLNCLKLKGRNHQNHQWTTLSSNLCVSVSP